MVTNGKSTLKSEQSDKSETKPSETQTSTKPSPSLTTTSTKPAQRFSSPTAVKTFSRTPTKNKPSSGVPQGTKFVPLAHSTPAKSRSVSSRDKVVSTRTRPEQGKSGVPEPRIPHGPKPITPKNLRLQKSNEKVIKPKKSPSVSDTMKPDFSQSSPMDSEERATRDGELTEIRTVSNNDEEDELCSVASDLSSIISFESPDQSPVVSEQIRTPSPSVPLQSVPLSKSNSCSNVNVLPSQRIENFMKESKYLYARSAPRGKSTNSPHSNGSSSTPAPNNRVKKSPSQQSVSSRASSQSSVKNDLGPPPSSRYSLRKSRSTQHTNTLQATSKTTKSKNLSPHLMYGIFNGTPAVPVGGLKKSRSTLKVKQNVERESGGGVKRSQSTVSYRGLRRCSSSLSVNSLCSEGSSEVKFIFVLVGAYSRESLGKLL